LQCVDQINDWFAISVTSIADAERAQTIEQRQRARSPRMSLRQVRASAP
jgi:hypothetical protein